MSSMVNFSDCSCEQHVVTASVDRVKAVEHNQPHGKQSLIALPCSWIERQQCYYPSSLYEHVLWWYEPNYEHVQWYEPNNCGSSVSDCCSRLFNQQHHRTHPFSEQHKSDNCWSCEYAAVFNEHCSSSTNSTPFLCNLNGNHSKASSCKITLCYCYGHWSP